MDLPEPVLRYLTDLLTEVKAVLGADLVGVYVTGSIAFGAFDPNRSDIDVMVVCHDEVGRAQRSSLVDAVRHDHLPCPARGLELVGYPRSFASAGEAGAGFVFEVNDGPAMTLRAHLAPEERDADDLFWYVIDRSITRAHGVALYGSPAAQVFAAPRDADVLDALRSSVRWHRRSGGDRNAVLNTCRALRWAEDRVWVSKTDAGEWWSTRHDEPVVREALADRPLPQEDVHPFLESALERLVAAT